MSIEHYLRARQQRCEQEAKSLKELSHAGHHGRTERLVSAGMAALMKSEASFIEQYLNQQADATASLLERAQRATDRVRNTP